MLPTFLIAGAAKSGSTTLWNFLKAHPQVYMAPMKEVNFFITDVWWARNEKGMDWYSNLFREVEGVKAYGEASINYMSRPELAELIHQALPQVTLLFILRDPVDRIYSQYWYERQEGTQLPGFDSFVRQRHTLLKEWIWGSRYDLHLKRFLNLFPEQQIRVILFSDLKRNPDQLVKNLYRAVGVDEEFSPQNLTARLNPTRRVHSVLLQRLIVRTESLAYPISLPPFIQRPMHRLRKSLRKANSSSISIPPMKAEQRAELLQEFSGTIDFIEQFLKRPLPDWRSNSEIEYNFPA